MATKTHVDDYEYDIFVSYRRHDDLTIRWVRKIFVPLMKHWAEHALEQPRLITYFLDQNMDDGINWSDHIPRSLRRSRVMVALLSKLYFRSDSCVSEFEAMRHRAELCRKPENASRSLIVPIIVHGSYDDLDPRAASIQAADIQRFFCSIWTEEARDYDEFDLILRRFGASVAHAIDSAPGYQDVPSQEPEYIRLTEERHVVQLPQMLGSKSRRTTNRRQSVSGEFTDDPISGKVRARGGSR